MQATYSKDKRNEGQYNVRVVGDGAHDLEGQTVHVRTASGAEKPETLGRRIWSGDDNGQPVALYAKGGYSGRSQAPGDAVASLLRRVEVLEGQVAALMGTPAQRTPEQVKARQESIEAARRDSMPRTAAEYDLQF